MKEKTATIRELVPPTNVHEIQKVMGMFNYYRKFITNLSEIAKGIVELTKKGVKFELTPERQVAFQTLKDHLTRSPLVIYPDPNKGYYLFTDASKYTWSAILMQIMIWNLKLHSCTQLHSKVEISRDPRSIGLP